MDGKKKRRGWWGWWPLAAVILAPIALYVGAYYATVTQYEDDFLIETVDRVRVLPKYRLWDPVLQTVFAPIHEIDCRLRHDSWYAHPAPLDDPSIP